MIGQKIKQLRKGRNITQRDLGKIIGVTHATIAMWENGKRQIDLAHLKQIADMFNVSMDWLLSEDDNMFEKNLQKEEGMVTLVGKNNVAKSFKLDDFQFQTLEKFVDSLIEDNQN